jgi:hypothetical protein
MRWSRCLAFTVVLAAVAPLVGNAQSLDDADAREIRAYRLTMPRLRQLNQAGLEAARQSEADPKYRGQAQKRRELKALQEKKELTAAEQDRLDQLEREVAEGEDEGEESDARSLSEVVSRIESHPQLSTALRKAGLPPREAAVMLLALFEAGFAAEMLESGAIREIPNTVNPDNVRFYQANKAELQSLSGLSQKLVR